MIGQEAFSVTRNTTLATLPILYKEFDVKLEINVNNFPNSWVNVFHMTIGGNGDVYGNRIPALFGNGGSNPYLHVCSAINGQSNYCKNFYISTNTWITVRISQRRRMNGTYVYEYVINNKLVDSVINNQPAEFKNVKVFASDPWYPPFSGSLRNIEICFIG